MTQSPPLKTQPILELSVSYPPSPSIMRPRTASGCSAKTAPLIFAPIKGWTGNGFDIVKDYDIENNIIVDAAIEPLTGDERSLAKGYLNALGGMGLDFEGANGVGMTPIIKIV